MGKQRILLVDDEPDILEFIEYNLVKEGYDVHTAGNGREGGVWGIEDFIEVKTVSGWN